MLLKARPRHSLHLKTWQAVWELGRVGDVQDEAFKISGWKRMNWDILKWHIVQDGWKALRNEKVVPIRKRRP